MPFAKLVELAGGSGPDGCVERGERKVGDVADGARADPLEPFGDGGSDTPERADRLRPQEGRGLGLGNDEDPVGLGATGGELGDELGRGGADRGDEPGLVRDAGAQALGDVVGRPEEGSGTAHVEERLVDAERLDERRHIAEDGHDGARDLLIALVARLEHDRVRAAAQRDTHGHGGVDAVAPSLVRRGRHDRACAAVPTMTGFPAARSGEQLDGGEERVHVEVQDARARVARRGLGDLPTGAVLLAHGGRLTTASSRLHPHGCILT